MRRVLSSACGILGPIWLLLVANPLWAVDYDKIDRTILKEPVYQSGVPKYVLLLFGPTAKRVWVVIDGETAFIDRNGDGDLTAADKRFVGDGPQHWTPNVEIPDPDGKTTYLIPNMRVRSDEEAPTGHVLEMNARINGPAKYKQTAEAPLWSNPQQAAILHFNGPLTIGPDLLAYKLAPWVKLKIGDQPADFPAQVGTLDEKHGCWVMVRSMNGENPEFRGVMPMVDIQFPSKTPGDPPVRQRYLLDNYCCQIDFKGDVKAPPEAGPGMAKVTFSFGMWKEGHVAPSTVEIPVITAEQAKQEEESEKAADKQTDAQK
ncbi:MAG TPA: hypothetical protein VMJ32_13870 [Pirellulales bacterium]|nr:hypothetical protein [Pirellulales bacterium]